MRRQFRFICLRFWFWLGLCFSIAPACAFAQAAEYSFGVVPHRSALLTAEYWNPILAYVEKTTGVRLNLVISRSVQASDASIKKGEDDFVYSGLIFKPAALKQGYEPILATRGGKISSQIVVNANSTFRSLRELTGKPVAFPSPHGYVAYAVPMDHLLRRKIDVLAVFAGTQEGALGQLKSGQVAAASVSGQVAQAYAAREDFSYRVLWQSDEYDDIPIAVHPRVPGPVVSAVRNALSGMTDEEEGRKILETSAAKIGQPPPLGFRNSNVTQYKTYIEFYRNIRLKDLQ